MSKSTSERIIILLRHAKADRPPGVRDELRPLALRGMVDASAAGVWLADNGYTPELVLCSPALRTKETWQQVASAFPDTTTVRYVPELYDGGEQELLALLRAVASTTAVVLVVGHNPTMELVAALLDPEHDGRMRTAELSVHIQTGPWGELGAGTAPARVTHVARG